jgi:hypothetical protein
VKLKKIALEAKFYGLITALLRGKLNRTDEKYSGRICLSRNWHRLVRKLAAIL